MSRTRFGLYVLLSLTPVGALGQGSPSLDTLPFRSGQWAMQFGGGFTLGSIGVLKFTAPTRAWLLDIAVSGGHDKTTSHVTVPTDTTASSFESRATVSVRWGRRFYQARGSKIASFQTLGVLGGFNHAAGGSSGGGAGASNGWSAGVFGELGAGFFLAAKLSIGGAAAATFSYTRTITRSSVARSVSWSYQGSAPAVRFVATIYF